jgi:hypothetical protein
MIQTVRNFYRATLFLIAAALVLGILGGERELAKSLSLSVLVLAFLTSCWCNVLLIRSGFIGKSSLVIWVLVSILGVPPIGFFAMLFLLSRSIKNIEITGKT